MDRWIRAAMADDSMVVELLLLLREKSSSSVVHRTQLKWGVRQPRSTPSSLRYSSSSKKKAVTSAATAVAGGGCRERCFGGSPTTPLSWSGGPTSASTPSPSATADFNEASSLPSCRSKVNVTIETATASSKRSRKKKIKTYCQLREEETMFLKESISLKKEIARLHASLKEQEARSQKLKRIRLDLSLQSVKKTLLHEPEGESCGAEKSGTVKIPSSARSTDPGPCNMEMEMLCQQRAGFVLPDLNMMPSDEDSGPQVLC